MLKKVALAILVLLVLLAVAVVVIARRLLGSEAVRVRVEQQLSAWTGQPVSIGAATASIFPRVALELRDVQVGQPAAATVRRVAITTGLEGLFDRRIEDAEVSLTDGTLTLPLPFALPSGELPAGPPAGPASGPATQAPGATAFTIASIRDISIENLEILAGAKRMRIDLESALQGDRLEVSRLSARSERSSLEASGTATSLARLEGTFTVKGDPLDLDELLALSSGVAGSGRGAPAGPVTRNARIGVTVTAPRGRFGGHDFTALATTLDVTPARIRMAPLAFEIFGGRFSGTMDVDPATEALPFAVRGQVTDLDVATLATLLGSPGAITGRLGGTVSMKATGTDTAAVLRNASATADIVATNGHIPNMDMVRAVVLAFGKPSGAPPPGSGSAYSRITGTFQLQRGILTSSNLALASRDFDMRGRMRVTVPQGGLDAHADVVLSKDLTAQSGTDLRRYAAEDGRVVLPARITGTLSRPAISIDIGDAVKRALENELKRKTKSLLDRLLKRKG